MPKSSAAEFEALVADIKRDGIQEPLRVVGTTILDGRHRHRAALELGLAKVPVVDVELGKESPEEFIVRTALHRRHLSDGQRAMMAARWAPHATPTRGRKRDAAGLMFNVPGRQVRDALELDRLARGLGDEVLAGRMKLGRALGLAKRAEQLKLIANTTPPSGKHRTICVDPPWGYDDAWCNGSAAREYVTMSDDEVLALNVRELADDTCHLYLWCGAPKLEVAFAAVRAWGFDVKTVLVWKKNRLGLGRYFRSQSEFVLFATKGKAPLREQALSNVFEAPVTKHSEKPEAFYELVERASFGPRLDMFARRHREGWVAWGAEVPAEPAVGGPTSARHHQDGPTRQGPQDGAP